MCAPPPPPPNSSPHAHPCTYLHLPPNSFRRNESRHACMEHLSQLLGGAQRSAHAKENTWRFERGTRAIGNGIGSACEEQGEVCG